MKANARYYNLGWYAFFGSVAYSWISVYRFKTKPKELGKALG